MPTKTTIPLVLLLLLAICSEAVAVRPDGKLLLKAIDSETREPLAARIHLKNSRGRKVRLRLPGSAAHADYFYFQGSVELPLRRGQYTFELECGPEYKTVHGHFEIQRHSDDEKVVKMEGSSSLEKEGWWAGDLDIHRPWDQLPLAMQAEELHVAPVAAWTTDGTSWKTVRDATSAAKRKVDDTTSSRVVGAFAAAKTNRGGRVWLFPGVEQLAKIETQDPAQSLLELSQAMCSEESPSVRAVAMHANDWLLPVWLAHDAVDCVGLINRSSLRKGVKIDKKIGRPHDPIFFPGNRGAGRWMETIYYHLLNCGLRVPPVAGSGSGDTTNPIGTNRVYAYTGDTFDYEQWWDAVVAGRVFVTNGPLLRVKVEGEVPGYVFRITGNEKLELEVGLNLTIRGKVDYLQIVKNGEVLHDIRLDSQWAKAGGRLPKLHFEKSGWFLIRAVTNNEAVYQFASTGPYYVQHSDKPRISRQSVQFFIDWLQEAAASKDAAQFDISPTSEPFQEAVEFWNKLLAQANAD